MAEQAIPQAGGLEGLMQLLSNFSDKKTTETTKSTMSTEQTAQLLKSLLSQTQGLASVAGGQKTAGLYNSTVNQQMINDLLSQVAAKTSQATSGTTRTVTQSAPVNAKKASSLVAGLQAASTAKNLLGPVASKIGAKYGMKDMDAVTDKIMGALGLGSSDAISGDVVNNFASLGAGSFSEAPTTQMGSTGLNFDLSSLGSSFGSEISNTSVDSLLNFATTLQTPELDSGVVDTFASLGSNPDFNPEVDSTDFFRGSEVSAASSTNNTSAGTGSDTEISWLKAARYAEDEKLRGNILDLSDGNWVDDIGDVSDAVSVAYAPAAFVRPALMNMDAFNKSGEDLLKNPGDWFSNILSGDDPWIETQYNMWKGAGNAVVDTVDMVGRGLETTVNAVEDVFSEVANALGSVICTELNRQGKLSKALYVYGQIPFKSYREDHKAGYYIWSIPTVRHLRKHPNSLYSKFIARFFNERAKYLAASQGCARHKKTLLGYLADRVSYYGCVGISYLVPKSKQQDWKVLYG